MSVISRRSFLERVGALAAGLALSPEAVKAITAQVAAVPAAQRLRPASMMAGGGMPPPGERAPIGALYYDLSGERLFQYDGSEWLRVNPHRA